MKAQLGVVAVAMASATWGCASGHEDGAELLRDEQSLTVPGIDLVAIGRLDGKGSDKSSKTAGLLENGVPGNLLGGLGSGLAFAGGNKFIAVPDRGPNAVAYDSAIDDTTSYIARFQTLKLALQPSASGAALPLMLAPLLRDTTLLFDASPLVYGSGAGLGVGSGAPALNDKKHYYFTGRSDNFSPSAPSTSPSNARFDPESVRVSRDGEHLYVSDEYGPYIYEFDRGTGRRVRSFVLPPEFAISTLSPQGAVEIASNTAGRVTNKGMEGLAITPDGKTLIGAMQSPLLQDGGTSGRFVRLIEIDIATGATSQFSYELTNIGTPSKPKYPTVSDILAVNDHELLVDERDGKGLGDNSTAVYKHVYHIDLTGAVEVSGIHGDANLAGTSVSKTDFLDLVATLNAHGIASNDIPAKLEGLAFGPDVKVAGTRKHTLFISNDNDFVGTVVDSNHPAGIDNPNQFFVFAFDSSALPGFVPQQLGDDGEQDDGGRDD